MNHKEQSERQEKAKACRNKGNMFHCDRILETEYCCWDLC